jgi:alpha-mannosidase
VEKMYAHAQVEGLLADDYSKEIRSAEETLLFSEFHDILPGSSIGIVEESSLDALGHGIETMKRLRSRLFFSLSIGMDKAKTGEIPILVYNPHPYPVSQVVECEFQLADQNWEDTVFDISVRGKGGMLPSQVEKEDSNIPLDWRKKVSFTAHLEPSSMNRFDCELSRVEPDQLYLKEQDFEVHTEDLDIRIDPKTGHIDYYKLGDKDFLERQSAKALVVGDTVDAWAMTDHSYGDIEGCFELMSPQESAKFCALTHETVLSPVRIVEDGAVRKIIEADMKYKDSTLNVRYVIPKVGSEIELELRVYWNEKDKILKWDFPLSKSIDLGVVQTMFGTQELDKNGQEGVQHKWCMAQNIENDLALSIINEGIYGVDIRDQSLRLSLVRSPGYSAHTIEDRLIMRQDRFSPRIDQGERSFKIWLNGGTLLDRQARIEIEAQAKNEAPMAVAAFPSALGKRSGKGLRLSNSKVVCSSIQLLSDDVCQIRLYNSSDSDQNCFIKWDEFGPIEDLAFGPFEFKILKLTRA